MESIETRLSAVLDEAKGVNPDEAKGQIPDNGTPDPDATVPQYPDADEETPNPDEVVDPDELKYSESSLQSAKEAALQEGREAALQERDSNEKLIRQRLLDAVKANNGDTPKVLRAVSEAIKALAPGLEDSDIDPPMKVVRDAMGIIEDAAFAVVGESYAAAINEAIGNEDEVKSFWTDAKTLDPSLDFSGVISLLVERKALKSKAIRDASPEDLIKASRKLKEHIDKFGDDKYKAGRTRGQKDHGASASSEGRASNGSQSKGWTRDDNGNIDVAASLASITGG